MVLLSSLCFGQNKINNKLHFFGVAQADIGLDLGSIVNPDTNVDGTPNYYSENPTYFTYGLTTKAGYQPFNWLALSSGLRYSFISPKFHNLYWLIQPYFFFSPAEDKDFNYLTFNYGTQINSTQGRSHNGFIGIGIGKFDLVGQNFAQKLQLNLDVHTTLNDAVWFLGLSYGIVIFSNKNL